jgi:hypothetical protein
MGASMVIKTSGRHGPIRVGPVDNKNLEQMLVRSEACGAYQQGLPHMGGAWQTCWFYKPTASRFKGQARMRHEDPEQNEEGF